VVTDNGVAVVDFERLLHVAGGRVVDVYPQGVDVGGWKIPRWCPPHPAVAEIETLTFPLPTTLG